MKSKLKWFISISIITGLLGALYVVWNTVYWLPENYRNNPCVIPEINISKSNGCFVWGIPKRKFEFQEPEKMSRILNYEGALSTDYEIPFEIIMLRCGSKGYISKYFLDSTFVSVMLEYETKSKMYECEAIFLREHLSPCTFQ